MHKLARFTKIFQVGNADGWVAFSRSNCAAFSRFALARSGIEGMIPPIADPASTIRFGTRGSALALAQTRAVVDQLDRACPGQATEIVIIHTEGDLDRTSPLAEIGGRGVFTSAIEKAILTGQIDAAVHSAKDLPTGLHPDAPIVAFPFRADPRDALVTRHRTTLDRLPANPRIGTSSRRRAVQILQLRPDARIVNIRGNIDTRLQKSEGSEFDAIVIAAAGLDRLGWAARASELFPVEQLVPSPGQGAIAIQSRRGTDFSHLLATIDNDRVSVPVEIERAFLAAIGTGCTTPVGAFTRIVGDEFRLVAMLADDSSERIAFANELLRPGEEWLHAAAIARRLQSEISSVPEPRAWSGWRQGEDGLGGARVVVTRPQRQAGQLLATLEERGAKALFLPTIRIEPIEDTSALDAALQSMALGKFDWLVFTSANAADAINTRMSNLQLDPRRVLTTKIAAIGPATARAATDAGFHVTLRPDTPTGERLTAALLEVLVPSDRVLYPRSAIGRDALPERLREAGINIVAVDAYRTVPEPDVDPDVLAHLMNGDVDAIAFASPSSIHSLMALVADSPFGIEKIPSFCAGPVTARAAREAGLLVAGVSEDPGATAMVDVITAHFCQVSSTSTTLEQTQIMVTEDFVKG